MAVVVTAEMRVLVEFALHLSGEEIEGRD